VWITLVKHELARSRIACNVVIRDVITSIAFPAFRERERERERQGHVYTSSRYPHPVPCVRKRGDTRATNTRGTLSSARIQRELVFKRHHVTA